MNAKMQKKHRIEAQTAALEAFFSRKPSLSDIEDVYTINASYPGSEKLKKLGFLEHLRQRALGDSNNLSKLWYDDEVLDTFNKNAPHYLRSVEVILKQLLEAVVGVREMVEEFDKNKENA